MSQQTEGVLATDLVVSNEFLNIKNIHTQLTNFTASLSDFFTKKTVFKDCEHLNACDDNNGSGLIKYRLTFNIDTDKDGVRTLFSKPYIDLRHTSAYVPSGMTDTYMNYLVSLQKCIEATTTLQQRVLIPFTRYLAENVNNTEELLKGNGVSVKGFDPINIDKLSSDLAKHFKRGSNLTKVKFSNVFGNLEDVKNVKVLTDELIAKSMNVIHKEVISSMDQISDHLDILTEKLAEDEFAEVSKRAADLLYKLAYSTARELEFYSIVQYQLKASMVALFDTFNNIERGK